jgi:limonene-1,2-epoxide hydrolase
MATDAEEIVTRYLAACERADVEEILAFFAEDAVWHPMPLEPRVGEAALREAISVWMSAVTFLGADIHHQVSDGRIVMNERTDRYLVGGQEHATRIGSVFEVADGRITAWREYFDYWDAKDIEAQRA